MKILRVPTKDDLKVFIQTGGLQLFVSYMGEGNWKYAMFGTLIFWLVILHTYTPKSVPP